MDRRPDKEENCCLLAEVVDTKNKLSTHMLTEDCLKERPDMVQFYTGLPSFTILTALYTLLEVSVSHTSRNALTKFQEMIGFLIRLRINVPLQDLAYRYVISKLVCYGVLKLLLAGFMSPRPRSQERSTNGWTLPLCGCDMLSSGQSDTPFSRPCQWPSAELLGPRWPLSWTVLKSL